MEGTFTARSHFAASSTFTTLDSGAAKGYVDIPLGEYAIVVHLCPQSAATGWNRLHLPSKAYKFLAALAANSYSAV